MKATFEGIGDYLKHFFLNSSNLPFWKKTRVQTVILIKSAEILTIDIPTRDPHPNHPLNSRVTHLIPSFLSMRKSLTRILGFPLFSSWSFFSYFILYMSNSKDLSKKIHSFEKKIEKPGSHLGRIKDLMKNSKNWNLCHGLWPLNYKSWKIRRAMDFEYFITCWNNKYLIFGTINAFNKDKLSYRKV